MKIILLIFLLLPITPALSQEVSIKGNIIFFEDHLSMPGVQITLLQDNKVIKEVESDMNGNYSFENIETGLYNMHFKYVTMSKDISNINVSHNLSIDIVFPCTPTNKKVCPLNHKNNIIPIAYGMPSAKMMKKAEKQKIKLGGCSLSCEKWHCKIHNIDF
jgi:hypothetical protein